MEWVIRFGRRANYEESVDQAIILVVAVRAAKGSRGSMPGTVRSVISAKPPNKAVVGAG